MSTPSVQIQKHASDADVVGFTDRHVPTQNWLHSVSEKFHGPKYTISDDTTIHGACPFGPMAAAKNGFVVASKKITYTRADGKEGVVPGIAFLRGNAVAILVILRVAETGEEHCVLTVQPRVPVADPNYIEIPAGMMDGSSNFAGKAAAELHEETGLTITQASLRKLGKMVPSAGGCDETIQLFLYKAEVSAEYLDTFKGKATGVMTENEDIVLRVEPLTKVREMTLDDTITDAKLMTALYYYDMRGDTSLTT